MNLVSLPHPNKYLIVEPLDYPNPYDYKIPHRHDYFEIILVRNGGGKQLIDFTHSDLATNSVYIIYPRQIHLLQRDDAEGLVIQFRKEIFEFLFPVQHHYLYFQEAALKLESKDFDHFYEIVNNIQQLNNSPQLSPLSIYKSYSYLQIVLISLIEMQQKQTAVKTDSLSSRFLELISHHVKEKRKVADYAEMLHITTDKLSLHCKTVLGTTPLKLIHEELLLEIKRLMILGKLSLKEICFELNFDSTANFSAFIKTYTRFTPSELQEMLRSSFATQ